MPRMRHDPHNSILIMKIKIMLISRLRERAIDRAHVYKYILDYKNKYLNELFYLLKIDEVELFINMWRGRFLTRSYIHPKT